MSQRKYVFIAKKFRSGNFRNHQLAALTPKCILRKPIRRVQRCTDAAQRDEEPPRIVKGVGVGRTTLFRFHVDAARPSLRRRLARLPPRGASWARRVGPMNGGSAFVALTDLRQGSRRSRMAGAEAQGQRPQRCGPQLRAARVGQSP